MQQQQPQQPQRPRRPPMDLPPEEPAYGPPQQQGYGGSPPPQYATPGGLSYANEYRQPPPPAYRGGGNSKGGSGMSLSSVIGGGIIGIIGAIFIVMQMAAPKAIMTDIDAKVASALAPITAAQATISDHTVKLNNIITWQGTVALKSDLPTAMAAGGVTQAQLTEANNKVAALETRLVTTEGKLSSLETKVNGMPINQQPQQTAPTGQVSFQVVNPQPWYTFGTSTIPVNVKIINNRTDTRYIKPLISVTTFNNQNGGTWNATSTIAVMSNSMGQPAILFVPTASPIGAVTNAIYIPTSGGSTNTGEYMLTPGSTMDLWINIYISTTNPVMWTLTLSGSDRPIY